MHSTKRQRSSCKCKRHDAFRALVTDGWSGIHDGYDRCDGYGACFLTSRTRGQGKHFSFHVTNICYIGLRKWVSSRHTCHKLPPPGQSVDGIGCDGGHHWQAMQVA